MKDFAYVSDFDFDIKMVPSKRISMMLKILLTIREKHPMPCKNENPVIQFAQNATEDEMTALISRSKAKLIISMRPYTDIFVIGRKFQDSPVLGLRALQEISNLLK